MAYSRKQVVAIVSVVYLIFDVALIGYAFARKTSLSIPIPNTLCGFVAALPVVSGVLLVVAYHFTRRQERRGHLENGGIVRPPLVIVANTLIFIYSAAVMTLLGTHTAPSSKLKYELEERWKQMFSSKDFKAIRTIQNALHCCGFMNSHDRAWPFPDKGHDAHACESAFKRTTGCLEPWRQEEQRLAGIMVAAVSLVFLWQMAIVFIPMRRQSWVLNQVLPGDIARWMGDERRGRNRAHVGVNGSPSAGDYHGDTLVEEVSDEEEGNAGRDVVESVVGQGRAAGRN